MTSRIESVFGIAAEESDDQQEEGDEQPGSQQGKGLQGHRQQWTSTVPMRRKMETNMTGLTSS